MYKTIFSFIGTIVGLLVSYLFRPSIFGFSPSFDKWFTEGFTHSETAPTIFICAGVGLVIGFSGGFVIDMINKKKATSVVSAKDDMASSLEEVSVGTQFPNIETMSLSDKLMNVFSSPAELFEYVAKSEKQASNYFIPLLLSIVIGVVFTFVVFAQPAIQSQMQEQQIKGFEKRIAEGKMTQEQMERAMEFSKPGSPMFLVFGAGGVIVVNILMLYIFALGFLLIGKFGFKSTASYGKHVEVVGLGMYVMVVSSLITMAMVIAMGSLYVSPSLALFVSNFDPMNKMHKLLSAVNVLTFWYLAVVAIGMSKLWNVTTAKALAGVFGAWVVWTALTTQLSFGM